MARPDLDLLLRASHGELQGELHPTTSFRRVAADLGRIGAGDLFIALPGERVDGHELVPIAAMRGAVAAVVARPWADRVRTLPLPLIVVDDPALALQQFAGGWRRQLGATVVGVTGSVGKTGTKEAVAAALSSSLRTYRSPGNRNNELGLPLSLLEVDPDTEVAILEMGAFAPGEIRALADIAQPHIGVVTSVGAVHLERMGSLDAVAEAKGELVAALPPDGVAVLNGDDPRVAAMRLRTHARVITFGTGSDVDVAGTDVRFRGLDGCELDVRVAGHREHVSVPFLGGHAVNLVLAAAAVGSVLGVAVDRSMASIVEAAPRLRPRAVPGCNGSTVIDDAYNASPPAVASALRLLADARAARRIAVLGDMRELGDSAEPEHRRVGQLAAATADLVVTVGALAQVVAREAARTGPRAAGGHLRVVAFGEQEIDEVGSMLQQQVQPGDVVLVKGSRSLALERIVDALRAT